MESFVSCPEAMPALFAFFWGLAECSPPFYVSAFKHFLKSHFRGWEGLLQQLFLILSRKGLGCQPECRAPERGWWGAGVGPLDCPVSLPSRPGRPLGRRVLVPECPQSHKTTPESWSEGFFICASIVSEAAADTASLFLIVPVGEGAALAGGSVDRIPALPASG